MQYSPLILSGGINGRHTERQHRVSKEIEKEHMSADIDPKWGGGDEQRMWEETISDIDIKRGHNMVTKWQNVTVCPPYSGRAKRKDTIVPL